MKKIEKILQYIEDQNISISEFERRADLSNGYINNTLKRGADITQKILDKIEQNLRDDFDKIFQEPASEINEPEQSYLEKRRSQSLIKTNYLVPFLPIKAQAGYVKAIDQEMYLDTLEKYALPPGVSGHGAIWRYWEIEGDSMEPVFTAGDIILTSFVHPMDWENLRNFHCYVIVTKERVLFKRVYCKNQLEWVLISENEDQNPQQLLPIESILEVWVYRKTWGTKAAPSKRFEIKI